VTEIKYLEYPDPKKHLIISVVKSLFRIVAGIALLCENVMVAGLIFIVAEIIGVIEELV